MDYLVVSNIASHGVGPAVNRSMPYDPLRDFTQIGLIVAVPSALGVTRDGKYETLAQFLTAARASGSGQGRFFRQRHHRPCQDRNVVAHGGGRVAARAVSRCGAGGAGRLGRRRLAAAFSSAVAAR